VLADLVKLVARNTLLVQLSLPKHLVDVVWVTLKVTTDEMLAKERVTH